MENYKQRIADKILDKKLKGKGAVLIQGPKWCGKTTTAEQISNSILYMSQPEDKNQNLTLVDINPSLLLKGETPRLIDEWQIAPKLWDAKRRTIYINWFSSTSKYERGDTHRNREVCMGINETNELI